jgi:hypothetical protein
MLALLSAASLVAGPPGEVSTPDRVVVGTVVSVHPASVTVRVPNLLGYLRIRIRTYKVRQPNSLIGLRPGDRISGVLSQTDGMLHRVRRIATISDLEWKL